MKTSASEKRRISKLELIKTYLRSTIPYERLKKLVIFSIEKNIVSKLEYKNLTNNFAASKTRKINFK